MNRKNLTAAVLAGLAGAAGIVGSAQAVYYTVNGGNQTLLSVVNTTDEAKAVKVRFKEGKNSREVLDFNLYLSAWDIWTAAIVDAPVACIPEEECAAPTMVTADTSCTVPYFYGNGGSQAFLPWGMNDTGVPDEYGPITRATEGYFEMIEMGTLVGESATAATHVDGVPADCDELVDAWTVFDDKAGLEGYWLETPLTDIEAPSGGLFGGAAIINVQAGHMYSYDAKAINDFATVADPNFLPLHNKPGESSPSLNSGDVLEGDVFVDGNVVTSTGLTRGVDAVSFVFMHDQVMNEYTTEALVGGATEWVLTFPTKSFYVYEEESGSADPVAPFTQMWDGEGACEVVLLDTIWDREEQTIVNPDVPGNEIPPIVSPAPPTVDPDVNPVVPFTLCYETSVIRYNADPEGFEPIETTPILGSSNFHEINNGFLGFEYGWTRLVMDDFPHDADMNGVVDCDVDDTVDPPVATGTECFSRGNLGGLEGLPVTGFAVNRFLNAFSGPGLLANYGGIFQHKYQRKIGSGDPIVPVVATPVQ
jgi:hypothetical protein